MKFIMVFAICANAGVGWWLTPQVCCGTSFEHDTHETKGNRSTDWQWATGASGYGDPALMLTISLILRAWVDWRDRCRDTAP